MVSATIQSYFFSSHSDRFGLFSFFFFFFFFKIEEEENVYFIFIDVGIVSSDGMGFIVTSADGFFLGA